jgi:DNA primase catalytic core
MARLSDEQIGRLKQDIALERLVGHYGIKLKRHSQHNLIGHCPFHNDKTPSFVVNPAKNLWNCLGACQCGGSVIDFVMKIEGISFRHAAELLLNDLPHLAAKEAEAPATPLKESRKRRLDSPLAADADRQKLLQQVIDYYHDTLKQSPEAQAYLAHRGLNDAELINHFKLGFANRTLSYRLPEKAWKDGKAIREQLQDVGILRESGHEHFNGSIVIPVMNEHGQITEVYARKIGNRLRKGTQYHLYLPGPHEGVLNIDAFMHHDEIILCEALIDALTFWRWGFRNVTTSYGVNGFTEDLLAAFKTHQIKRVLIAYDRDQAGDQAAERTAARLMEAGMDCFRIQLPKGMDVNEYAKNVTPAEKSLGLVIRKAQWLGKGKQPEISTAATLQDSGTTATKEKTTEAVTPSSLAAKSTEPEAPKVTDQAAEVELPAPPSASPLPAYRPLEVEAEITDNEILIPLGDRTYRVRGLYKATSYDVLKVNLLVTNDAGMHVDSFDLYSARHRQSFIKQASLELGVEENALKKDLGKVLLKLEKLQQQQIEEVKAPKETPVFLNDDEQREALALLQDPRLLDRILDDFKLAGVVGEETNKLVGYLASVSRKLDNPLAVLIQSTSAAGKSSLMNAVLAMMPEEERIQYSAMTGQSLFYMGETNLKHKILAIAEEEGAENASYALKLLQSEGELTMASTGKDAEGNLTTQEYRVEGPVMLFSTTTAIDIDEELMNRCLVLTVNESREQTRLIHRMQRRKRTLDGLRDKANKQAVLKLHQNAQRLIKPLAVMNPYADHLTFLDDKTRTRRDHDKYLSLIDTIALLHQYQREVKTEEVHGQMIEYIEVTLADIEIANRLAHDVLGRTLDELPPQTRRLLKLIKAMVDETCREQQLERSDYRFSRRQIRDATGWSDNQLKVHCRRLEDMEYLLVHQGSRGKSMTYELLYDGGEQGKSRLMGLIDTEQLLQSSHYDAQKLGQEPEKLGPSCPQVGTGLGVSWIAENTVNPMNTGFNEKQHKINGKRTTVLEKTESSHRTATASSLAAQTSGAGL